MSTRISSLAIVLLLAACGEAKEEPAAGEQIACALDGKDEFAEVCSVERKGSQVTVRRPDGGFRRFEISAAGQVGALDGAEPVTRTGLAGGMIELEVGDDRYRLMPREPVNAPKP